MPLATRMISLDVETECAVAGCNDTACKHALDPYRARITVAGLYWRDDQNIPHREVFRDPQRLGLCLSALDKEASLVFVGHNFKFDLRMLKNAWQLDYTDYPWFCTQLLSVVYRKQIPKVWLDRYEAKRKELNKGLPPGKGHRPARGHSLKTLAPYHLGVEPFWEATTNHDNDDYVIRDCQYTLELFEHMRPSVEREAHWPFYERYMSWNRLLLEAEEEGVLLDFDELERKEAEAQLELKRAKRMLESRWGEAFDGYEQAQENDLRCDYEEKCARAIARLKHPTPEKVGRTEKRYEGLYNKAVAKLEPFNMNSDSQMLWLLRDYLGLDVENNDGKESTGVEVLERLSAEGHADISEYLRYRGANKLATAFFPSYRAKHVNGLIHCSFNPSGARTGRLSSSDPNMQQVPGHLHTLFRAGPGHKLVTLDAAGIEPALIAYYSQDEVLFSILASGESFHNYVCSAIFEEIACPIGEVKDLYPKERKFAKEFGLSLLYGARWRRIQASSRKHGFNWGRDRCQRAYQSIADLFEGVFDFKKELDARLRGGEAIINLFGRPLNVDPGNITMTGFNTMIQGSASDMLMESARRDQEQVRDLGAKVLLLVHDEKVIRAPTEYAEEVYNIAEKNLITWNLTTRHGQVTLQAEGKVSDTWEK